jgi:hypothetical protein
LYAREILSIFSLLSRIINNNNIQSASKQNSLYAHQI